MEASASDVGTGDAQDPIALARSDGRPAWRRIPGIGRMQTASRALGASIGVIAAIASVFVGYLAIPKGITSEDWGRRVNAVCEMNAGELRQPLRRTADGLASLTTLLQDPSQVSAAGADLTTISNDIQDTADSYRQVIGQIRELDRPEETSGIDALLGAGSDLYRSLDSIAAGLVTASTTIANLVASPEDLTLKTTALEQLDSLQTVVTDDAEQSLEAYQAAVDDLRLEQCEVNSTQPTNTDESPHSDGGLDEDETVLAGKFGIEPSQCSRFTGPDLPSGAVARLNCSVLGLERDPFFIGFVNAEDLQTWFAPDEDWQADCGAGKKAEYPLPAPSRSGRLRCYPVPDGYRVDVMLSDLAASFSAEAAGPIGLERQVLEFVSGLDPS